MNRVLVTGASGMLGGAVARLLIQRGADVTVLQRRTAELDCRQVNGDLTDPGVLARAVHGQDVVVHLAAKVDVTGRWADYLRVNVEGTEALLAAARSAGAGRFVGVSSPSVAHTGHALVGAGAGPADPVGARGNYARSKALAERLVLAADDESLATCAVRPHLVWGPGDTQLVGRIVERARAGRLALVGGGTALIDTTYVDNAATAIVSAVGALDSPTPGAGVRGHALVVSNGEPRPVADIVAALCRAAGAPVPRITVPYPVAWAAGAAVDAAWGLLSAAGRRLPDPPLTRFLATQLATAHWFDQRETRRLLAWRPTVTIDEGLARMAAAFRPVDM